MNIRQLEIAPRIVGWPNATDAAILVIAVLTLAIFPAVAGESPLAATWKGIDNLAAQVPISVTVEKERRIYFRVTPQQPLTVPIKGPARLRVVSRAELPAAPDAQVIYRVRVATARMLLEEQEAKAPLSTDASIRKSPVRLGQSRQLIVSVPKGSQSLKISVDGASAVLIRLLTAVPATVQERTVSLTPVEAARSVSLKEDEKLIPYYSALPNKPLRFRIIGPTTLDLITRLDFDSTMRGVEGYRLAITDGGKPLRTVEYKTTKALTAVYSDLPDRIPSKFRRLTLPITAGSHDIAVALVKPKSGSVEIHARIPEPTVGNAE